VTKTISQVISA